MTINRTPTLELLACLAFILLPGPGLQAQIPLRRDLQAGWSRELRTEMAGTGHAAGGAETSSLWNLSDSWRAQGLDGYDGVLLYGRTLSGYGVYPDGMVEPAVLLGPMAHGWYRLMADDVLIGSYGSPQNQTPFPRDQIFPLPPELLEDGELRLLLEVHRVGWASDASDLDGPMMDGATIGPRSLLDWETRLAQGNLLRRELGLLLFSTVALFFGLYHLLLFATRRDQLPYAWFGISCVLMALNAIAFSSWSTPFFSHLGGPYRLTTASGHLATATLIPFFWGVLDRPVGRVLRGYQLSHVALGLLVVLLPLRWVIQSEALRFFWLLPVLVGGLLVLLNEARGGNPDARTLLLGGLILALCELAELGRVLNLPVPGMLPYFGFMALILAMAGTLAGRFSRALATATELRDDLELRVRERTAELEEMTRVAQEADEAKGRFLAVVTHEIQNPLKSITGFASLLLRGWDGERHPKEREYLERIRAGGSRLLSLSQDLLDLARIEAGRMSVRAEKVELEGLVKSVRDELAGQLLGHQVEILAVVPESLDALRSDPLRLRQVLLNLGGNGIRFMENGPLILTVLADGTRPVAIEVTDDGPGISPDQMEAVFEPFHRAETPRRSLGGGGAGLGLSIARSLCDLLGYTLSVRSQQGVGSTFTVHLTGEGGVSTLGNPK